jgi:hypothetical protein
MARQPARPGGRNGREPRQPHGWAAPTAAARLNWLQPVPLPLSPLPDWLQRWNFIERARHERQLWEAFERGEDLEALVERCRQAAATGEPGAAFQLEIWQSTLVRLRRLEAVMKETRPPGGERDPD